MAVRALLCHLAEAVRQTFTIDLFDSRATLLANAWISLTWGCLFGYGWVFCASERMRNIENGMEKTISNCYTVHSNELSKKKQQLHGENSQATRKR